VALSPIGHPLGASGARIMTHGWVNALEQGVGGRYGFCRPCAKGGGMGQRHHHRAFGLGRLRSLRPAGPTEKLILAAGRCCVRRNLL